MSHSDDRDQPTRSAGAPYPFTYSKDPWDERRFMGPGDRFAPASNRVSRAGVIMTWAILLGVAALVVVSIVASILGH